MVESRAERSALGAAPDIAAVDVGLNFENPTLLNHTSKKTNDPNVISTFFRFVCTNEIVFAP